MIINGLKFITKKETFNQPEAWLFHLYQLMINTHGEKRPLSSTDNWETWRSRVEAAEKALENFNAEGDRFVRYYNNDYRSKNGDSEQKNHVNLVYVDMKQSVPELYNKDPKFYVDYEDPDAEAGAEVAELFIDSKWKTKKAQKFIRDLIKGSKLRGVGALKTFWSNSKYKKDIYDDSIQINDFRTIYVNIKELSKDPNYCWRKSPYIVHKVNDSIQNIANIFNIQASSIACSKDHTKYQVNENPYDKNKSNYAFKIGTYWEIEDRYNKQIIYLVDGYDGLAQAPRAYEYDFDSMYDFLYYNDIPEKGEPHSDFFFWESQIKTINNMYQKQIDQAEKAGKVVLVKGVVDDETAEKIKSGLQNRLLMNLPTNLTVEVADLTSPDMLAEQAERKARMDAQIISKNAPRAVEEKTATEAKINALNVQKISSESIVRLEEVIESVAMKWLKLANKFYDVPRKIKISKMNSGDFAALEKKIQSEAASSILGSKEKPILQISKGFIDPLNLILRIKAGSTTPDNQQSRIAKIKSFIGDLAQLLQLTQNPQMSQILNVKEVILELQRGYGLEKENILASNRSPLVENELLEKDIIVLPEFNEDHDYHLSVHMQLPINNVATLLHIESTKKMKMLADKMKGISAPQMNMPEQNQAALFEQLQSLASSQSSLMGDSINGSEQVNNNMYGAASPNNGNQGGTLN